MNLSETDYPEYPETHYPDDPKHSEFTPSSCSDAMCIFLAVANVIISVLGVAGNGLVIWISGFKLKRSINTTWYLSLAMSDLLFCSFLPFHVIYMVKQDWFFGLFMCKFMSFIMFLNMFSSIFLLVIISVDRCVVVMFPVWAQNQRSIKKASVIVTLAWIISTALSAPAITFRHVEYDYHKQSNLCYNHYTDLQDFMAIVVSRLIFGFVIPFLIIIICYVVIIRKLNTSHMARSTKPFKIMTVLIVTFFICWFPFHTVALMELNHDKYYTVLPTAQRITVILAFANSCMNPFLYAFMGKDFKKKCYAVLSKIENAIEEEGRSTAQRTSFTTSGEKRFSTAV